jgi:hypothetical protein
MLVKDKWRRRSFILFKRVFLSLLEVQEERMRTLFMLLLGVAVCMFPPCEAKSHMKQTNRTQKKYVDPQVVRVTKDGVFVFQRGQLFPVKSVSKDRRGLFVVLCSHAPKWTFTCAYCHKKNNISAGDIAEDGSWRCQHCGRRNT